MSRRDFFARLGRWLGGGILALTAGRSITAWWTQTPPKFTGRKIWRIDPNLCIFCGLCASACVRRPSAVKAHNDQKICANCVVCHGHISNWNAPTEAIDNQPKICPNQAVRRIPYAGGPEGYFIYKIDQQRCIGCGRCARECQRHGTRSMFLFIRPDLCLGCNECAIAKVCPPQAISAVSAKEAVAALPSS